jgi:DNA-binding transcriptional ArsR family regulator
MSTATLTPTLTSEAQARFFALGEPVRLSIVTRLAEGSLTAGELAEPFKISRPAISRHLRLLREAGIARAEVRGRQWWYTLEPSTLSEMQGYLEEVNQMWQAALGSLKHYVEEDHG